MSLTLARIKVGDLPEKEVQFNPASLRVTVSNQVDDNVPNQVSKPTSFKLDVELLFDTTESGEDIFTVATEIRKGAMANAQGARPHDDSGQDAAKSSGGDSSHLKLITFKWGVVSYKGYIESLSETIDYWSSDGVPLRSTFQLSIKGTTRHFAGVEHKTAEFAKDNPAPALPAVVMTSVASDEARFTSAAAAGGDGSTGRGLAALNGAENMRGGGSAVAGAAAGAGFAGAGASAGAGAGAGFSAGAGAGIAVGGGAQLQAAAGFAASGGISAGASAGFGIGASAGLSASAGIGASVGVGMAAGAGIGGGIGIGGGFSAGAGFGGSAGFGAGAGIGMSAGFGGAAGGGGVGFSTSTSVTGFDGVTTTTTSSMTGFDGVTHTSSATTVSGGGFAGLGFGSASAGVSASAGAFAGLGASRTTLPGGSFNPDLLLPPPAPGGGTTTSYDVSGRAVSGNGQVAASYTASAGVTVW